MNVRQPIYTESTECQDCYKCVRGCPVKAIRVRGGHASVEPDTCIYCGRCVTVCPNNAKKVRDDLVRARRLVELRERVYVSLAPSFVSEFTEWKVGQLVAAIEALGCSGVSETALGAEGISREVEGWFSSRDAGMRVSTACPVVVDLITKYYDELVPHLGNTPSPLIAHGAMLREEYGDEIGIIFIGPCIGKKCESDAEGTPIDVSLTFQDLRRWLKRAHIDPATLPDSGTFVPRESTFGRRYPVDGGMSETFRLTPQERFDQCVRVSGIAGVKETLEGLRSHVAGSARTAGGPETDRREAQPIFLELLACEGGCINGPGVTAAGSSVARRGTVLTFANDPKETGCAFSFYSSTLPQRWYPSGVSPLEVTEVELRGALLTVGKRTREDELNCGGCGYDTCREFGRALVTGKAETAMCVAYMRRLAQKKSNALLKTMPSAVVTVDASLRIVECNRNFARLCGTEAELVYDALPGMEGTRLQDYLPATELFAAVLHSGEEIRDKTLRIGEAIVTASIFSIEDHHMVGAIMQDVTAPTMHRSQIAAKTKEVIDKNLATVQQIAYLLGENASETELILNSIRRSFGESGDAQ